MYTYPQREELYIWILMVQSSLQGTHSILGRNRLGPNLVTDFEVESDILGTRWKELRGCLV